MEPTAATPAPRPLPTPEAKAGVATLLVTGTRAGRVADAPLDRIAATLGERGPVHRIDPVSASDLAAALRRFAHDEVVVAGGDGTLHEVLGALHRRHALAATPVGLIPLGTANDFARGVGLPLDPLAAAEVARSGRVQAVDLVVDEGGGREDVVANVVHLGIGARAATAAAPLKGLVGAAAYPLGALLTGLKVDAWNLEVLVDGARAADQQTVVFVALCNGSTIGGGTPLCPTADPTDGLLDVLVVTAPSGIVDAAGLAAAAGRGALVDHADVVHRRGRVVRIAGQPVGEVADGELADDRPEHHFRLLPGAWRLRLP